MSVAGLLLLKAHLWFFVGATLATGCASVPAASELANDVQAERPRADPAMQTEPTLDSGMKVLVEMAVADLAARLSLDQSAVEVVSVEELTWPDPSLGCPQPGMKYQQIPVDGYRIRLRVAGQTYAYHGGGNRPRPFLCQRPARTRAAEGDSSALT